MNRSQDIWNPQTFTEQEKREAPAALCNMVAVNAEPQDVADAVKAMRGGK